MRTTPADRHEAQHERLGEQLPREARARRRGPTAGTSARADVARASSRLATFAQAISRTSVTAPRAASVATFTSSGAKVSQRPHVRAPALVLGVGRGEPVRHGAQLVARPLDRHTRLEPPESCRGRPPRGESCASGASATYAICRKGKFTSAGSTPTTVCGRAVDAGWPADDGRIGLAAATPELIGQDDDRSGRPVVGRVDLDRAPGRCRACNRPAPRQRRRARDPRRRRASGCDPGRR